MNFTRKFHLAAMASASFAAISLGHAPAFAQGAAETTAETPVGEIVVTARKREETAIEVPVSVTALGQEQLSNYGINSVDSVARAVPSLIVGEGGGTIQGGIVAIRGLAGADNNPLNDQAVSFNIDGVSIGRATVRRLGDMDLQQVEVLKGPQALFFGKNSPAGIISIRTADPTDVLEAKISTGYEFKAREWRTEGYVSSPLTDTLGVRLAGFYSDMKGWSKSIAPRDVITTPTYAVYPNDSARAPNKEDWGIRGTLKYDNGADFDARLKLTYGKVTGDGSTSNTQYVNCPLGAPQASPPAALGLPIDDCKADNRSSNGSFGPNLHNADPVFAEDGQTYMDTWQLLGAFEMNYHPTDTLTLTSVTGLYKQDLENLGNFTQNYYQSATVGALPSRNDMALREFSQELRLTSSFDGPVNFMVGGLFGDTKAEAGSATRLNTFQAAPTFVNKYHYKQEGKAYSVFGQVIVNPIPEIEISGGARASWEKKKLAYVATASNAADRTQLVEITAPGLDRKVSFDDISPEATIAYKPHRDLNVYASYKEGFLSGGFSALTPTPGVIAGTQQVTYDQQVTKGFEAGIKTALFDRTLRLNLAVYTYKTTGLQVGVTTQGVQQELRNAGSVRTKGVEFDFNYRTPVEGLTLNGAVNYNKAYYIDYQASCYRGQPSEECFQQVNNFTGLTSLLQDLSGTPLVRAPRWTANAGFNYERPVGENLKIGLSGNISYSDKYFTDTTSTPGGIQPDYELVDASLRLSDVEDTWEVAFIGKNLTNSYYIVRSSDTPFTGSNPGALSANDPTRIMGDTAGYVSRGREFWVRLSYKFGGR